MTDADEWIDAYSALARFEALFLDRVAAKSTIADYLRDGELRAWADVVFRTRKRKIGEAWKEANGDENGDENVELLPIVWRRSKLWAEDQAEWRWPFNKFSITTSTSPFRRDLIAGIKFHKADFDKILRRRNLSKGGAPTKDTAWTAFWHAILQLSQEQRLGTFATQAALRAEVLELISDELTDGTIKPVVSQIWQKFISKDNPICAEG